MAARLELVEGGRRRALPGTAAELALELEVQQALVNGHASGSLELHWGPDGVQAVLHLRGPRRRRLTPHNGVVLDSR